MYCNRCGHHNPPHSRFCSSCGAALAPASDETTDSFPALEDRAEAGGAAGLGLDEVPEGVGMLVVERGPNAGSRYLLDRDLTRLGRHAEADILLDDITVSRRHAEVQRSADGYAVRDAGSLNGTYLNRERVEEGPLRDGDELQIGRFRLVFCVGSRGARP